MSKDNIPLNQTKSQLVYIDPQRIDAEPFTTSDRIAKPINAKHVYVLKSETGLVKIGVSAEYDERKRCLETQSGFVMTNEYVSPLVSNYGYIESTAHAHFVNNHKLGEWYQISFDEATVFVRQLILEKGKQDYEYIESKNIDMIQFYKTPSAMEYEQAEDPEYHNYLVSHGYTEYWVSDPPHFRVTGEVDGEVFDMDSKLFLLITSKMHKGEL